jgi:hypothetical protein
MRRDVLALGTLLAVLALGTGCAKQQDTASLETTTDSLLATSPIEQPQGDLTPQEQFTTEPETPPATPVAAPTPKPAPSKPAPSKPTPPPAPKGVTLAAGTPIEIEVTTQISSETAQVGDVWSGTVKQNIIVGNTVVIPAGSTIHGVVDVSREAGAAKKEGEKALLGLAVKSFVVDGKEHSLSAGIEPIEAGSTRARNMGAVAGGAAAGALIGQAAGGGKGALIGGLIGGAAAGAGVAASKGYQVVIKEGTPITFTVKQDSFIES